MPIVLYVNYTPSAAQQAQTAEERIAAAHRITELDGFGWKIWVRNAETNARGGIYLFDDLTTARAWGESVRERLGNGGATNLTVTYSEIDPEPSAVTHAPIKIAAAVS